MPNGHGGIPKFGSAVVLLILLVGAIVYEETNPLFRFVSYPLAAGFGWRLAWHLCMYHAMEYGGAYTSRERKRAANFRYKIALSVLVPGCVAVVALLNAFRN
jgi:hypothetical protein